MLLKTINLSKKYGQKVAVDSINLSVPSGSFTALLGPNGAGKSTTLKMLIGILDPTSGQVIYRDNIKVGVVFQNSVLDDDLTVKENLNLRAQLYKKPATKYIPVLVKKLGLTNFLNQNYGTLSGGQKRRVNIARALLNQPDILFLDEPTTGLDIQTRLAIWQLLQQLQEIQGLTIILTTHYLDEANYADQIYIIDHGQMIVQGSAEDIRQQYSHNQLILFTNQAERIAQSLSDDISVKLINQNEVQFTTESASQALNILNQYQSIITNFEYHPGSLDDAFVNLTGKDIR
ncbi:ABC transporter ATP-binding protein [Convivina intestini]|uniref:ABC-type multidrug transport system ATPase subunit n=1 Tax=Convivina intestini TaxID=1505726 RepID=A0A2U1DF46_9LACO|nr:ABC transporter ATP-binding protein [Convivina intestini]PVY86297.1 ABC-type multidrug transport system ATPase subunit [Convivina intestini]CAH1850981.1 Daunorubicin/doxorubicin resistance ATP-binding protein DrrA [Convivina intestini]SDB82272.1 multidrug/hemolysin transport system ATP-binding protein [Leuconostocaceae bacterium R-53105]